MSFVKYYSKEIMEPFALSTIALSFDKRYEEYNNPKDTDNFDFISSNNENALEVTTAIPENMMRAYIYEKQRAKGISKVKTDKLMDDIRNVKINDNGDLVLFYGGSMSEIKLKIKDSIQIKQEKALKRLKSKTYKNVDLCICIDDGGLFDKYSFDLFFEGFEDYIFDNISTFRTLQQRDRF